MDANLLPRIKTGAGSARSLRDRDSHANIRSYDPTPCKALSPEYKVSSYSSKDKMEKFESNTGNLEKNSTKNPLKRKMAACLNIHIIEVLLTP